MSKIERREQKLLELLQTYRRLDIKQVAVCVNKMRQLLIRI